MYTRIKLDSSGAHAAPADIVAAACVVERPSSSTSVGLLSVEEANFLDARRVDFARFLDGFLQWLTDGCLARVRGKLKSTVYIAKNGVGLENAERERARQLHENFASAGFYM